MSSYASARITVAAGKRFPLAVVGNWFTIIENSTGGSVFCSFDSQGEYQEVPPRIPIPVSGGFSKLWIHNESADDMELFVAWSEVQLNVARLLLDSSSPVTLDKTGDPLPVDPMSSGFTTSSLNIGSSASAATGTRRMLLIQNTGPETLIIKFGDGISAITLAPMQIVPVNAVTPVAIFNPGSLTGKLSYVHGDI